MSSFALTHPGATSCPSLERSGNDARLSGLWPIIKRLPAYIQLAWALIKEPAIPARHKLPLGCVVAYELSPPHMVIGAIPILGQLDSLVLFLLAIQHALAHCPAKVIRHQLARLKLSPTQMSADMMVIRLALRGVFGQRGRAIGKNVRFAGSVTYYFVCFRLHRMRATWLAE